MSTDISYIKEKCQKAFVHTCTPGYPKYLYWYIFDNNMNYNFLKGKRTGHCEDVHECGYTCIPSSASLISLSRYIVDCIIYSYKEVNLNSTIWIYLEFLKQ